MHCLYETGFNLGMSHVEVEGGQTDVLRCITILKLKDTVVQDNGFGHMEMRTGSLMRMATWHTGTRPLTMCL